MYTYRECIVLGKTNCSILKVNQILRELSREWPGNSYDLLAKNCNHFCDEFCEKLGVQKLPGKVQLGFFFFFLIGKVQLGLRFLLCVFIFKCVFVQLRIAWLIVHMTFIYCLKY